MPKSTTTQGPPYFSKAATPIHDAIGADLRRIVIVDGHSGFDSRLDVERPQIEIALAHLAQHRIERRNYGRNYDSPIPLDSRPAIENKFRNNHPVFIHGTGAEVATRQLATSRS